MPKSSRITFALKQAYVEMIHDRLVSALWPADEPIAPDEPRNRGLVGSAVARPFQTMFGQALYRGVFRKGAALFHSLIANHPFYNGNKRTAVLSLDHFLTANGCYLALTNDEMYQLAKQTATYREQGISHNEIFEHIVLKIRQGAVPVSQLRNSREFAEIYQNARKIRKLIRENPLNENGENSH